MKWWSRVMSVVTQEAARPKRRGDKEGESHQGLRRAKKERFDESRTQRTTWLDEGRMRHGSAIFVTPYMQEGRKTTKTWKSMPDHGLCFVLVARGACHFPRSIDRSGNTRWKDCGTKAPKHLSLAGLVEARDALSNGLLVGEFLVPGFPLPQNGSIAVSANGQSGQHKSDKLTATAFQRPVDKRRIYENEGASKMSFFLAELPPATSV
ncbi:hypothetical protein B0T21DRAFT_353042 [Apiosordaria backusii]|uniref:Uncharacterized protein n=1 Tax=Apiosordaria backusii TaxID=314023 RepID=A0AA39ZY34_9PEZI|nr:hypothetical protein B0T21DRAFT_353042 [Apiosordaria backusii]